MERLEKLQYLQDTLFERAQESIFLEELVRWMGEHDFNEFYDHFCRNWEIEPDPSKEL
jgi:hypothetical protein